MEVQPVLLSCCSGLFLIKSWQSQGDSFLNEKHKGGQKQKPGYQRIIARLEKISCSHHIPKSFPPCGPYNKCAKSVHVRWMKRLLGVQMRLRCLFTSVRLHSYQILDCFSWPHHPRTILLITVFFFSWLKIYGSSMPHVDAHAWKSKVLTLTIPNVSCNSQATNVIVLYLVLLLCSFIMGYTDGLFTQKWKLTHHLLVLFQTFLGELYLTFKSRVVSFFSWSLIFYI